MSSNKAWVTLATNDSYSLGALVLAHSLKIVKTEHKLAILITPGVTPSMKQQIEAVFDDVRVVDVLDSKDQTHLALMSRPELGVTFTKLHCWTFTKYEKCVFLDADTLVLQNCDELFDREEFSAAPDPGWPDCFNSGVFVYKPSENTFAQLLEFARTRGSFDGGDQGLLNMFFSDWASKDISKHLSFTYNVVWSSTYSYLPALKQFGQNMKIIHFIASSKPWLQSFNTETRLVTATSGGSGLQTLLQFWWDLFCRYVHPGLSTEMIESRLSSRYSYDFHYQNPPKYFTSNNYNPSNNYLNDFETPTNEPPKEDHFNFIDPWEEYLVRNEQHKNVEVENKNVHVYQNENAEGGGNMVEVCLGNPYEEGVENNYYTNNYDTEEKTRGYSFQNNVVEECNTFGNEEKNNVHYEEVREFNEPNQEQNPRINENHPTCSDYIPNNLNSNLSVNNHRSDSPTHSEVPKDQACNLDGGLAGQFARISLDTKTVDQKALEDFIRRQSWEQGNMDYLGKDSFTNIWAKINETLGVTPEVVAVAEPVVVAPKPSAPEIVHSEEPKPLKSALKKSSTITPPVESELIEPPVKQLEKLDLSKDISNQAQVTPETPTVTSPTPPTTPASIPPVQESQKPASAAVIEAAKEASEPEKPTPKDDTVEVKSSETVVVEPPKPTQSVAPESADSAKQPTSTTEQQPIVSQKPAEQPQPLAKQPQSPAEQPQSPAEQPQSPAEQPQSPAETNPIQQVPIDPPVAPKRANKGAPAKSGDKPVEKK